MRWGSKESRQFYGEKLRWHTLGDYEEGHAHLYSVQGYNNSGAQGFSSILVDMGLRHIKDSTGQIVKSIFPDVTPYILYLGGIFLTHGHQDHVGGLHHVIRLCRQKNVPIPPIYGSAVTLAVVKKSLIQLGLSEDYIQKNVPLSPLVAGQTMNIGGLMSVTVVPAPHSFAHSFSYFIAAAPRKGEKKPAATAFHSGDCKMDPTLFIGSRPDIDLMNRLREWSGCEEGEKEPHIDALMMDSTNSTVSGYLPTEGQVHEDFVKIATRFKDKNLIFITTASNHQRLANIFRLAKKFNKRMYLHGRRLIENFQALEQGANMSEIFGIRPAILDTDNIHMAVRKESIVVTNNYKVLKLAKKCLGSNALDGSLWLKSSGMIFDEDPAFMNPQGPGVLTLGGHDYMLHSPGHGNEKDQERYRRILRPRGIFPVHGFGDPGLNAHAEKARADGYTVWVARKAGMGAEFSRGQMKYAPQLEARWVGVSEVPGRGVVYTPGLDGEGNPVDGQVISLADRRARLAATPRIAHPSLGMR